MKSNLLHLYSLHISEQTQHLISIHQSPFHPWSCLKFFILYGMFQLLKYRKIWTQWKAHVIIYSEYEASFFLNWQFIIVVIRCFLSLFKTMWYCEKSKRIQLIEYKTLSALLPWLYTHTNSESTGGARYYNHQKNVHHAFNNDFMTFNRPNKFSICSTTVNRNK